MATHYIFTDYDNLSLTIDNVPYTVDSSHKNWDAIMDALRNSEYDIIPGLINEAKALEAYIGLANIVVNAEYGTITYAGRPIHNTIVDHIFRMRDEGFDINPMLKFLDNLMDNPSKRAVDELYGFLQAGKMPITEDGHFIAYKRVRSDYKSVYDGVTDNSIGTVLEMPRNMVNENSNETCSHGLHFCSHAYLKHFSGDKVVVLKINPRDVVSIPADYNDTKGRACRYEVIDELSPEQVQKALAENVFTEAVYRSEYDEIDTDGYDDDEWGYDEIDTYRASECDHNGEVDTADLGSISVGIFNDRQMYDIGYKDGRSRQFRQRHTNEAYNQGYADGRGHKARKYK